MIYLFGLTYDIYSFASPWHVSRLGNGKTAITAVEIRIHFYYQLYVVLFNLRMFNKSSDRDDVRLPMHASMLVGKFYHRCPNRNWTQKGWTYSRGSLLYIFQYFVMHGLTSSYYFPYIENSAWQRSLEDINKGNWITCLFIFLFVSSRLHYQAVFWCALKVRRRFVMLCFNPSSIGWYPGIFLRQNGGCEVYMKLRWKWRVIIAVNFPI